MRDLDHSHKFSDIHSRLSVGPKISYLRDWIYGGIDGAVTTFAIVAGVVGAELTAGVVVVLGIANLLADGFSMAASNYSGTKAEIDDYKRMLEVEKRHIRQHPEGEREEVRQIFANKGYSGEELDEIVTLITTHEDMWLETMMTEEYGLSNVQRSPVKAALATFWAFLLCGAVPLLPYFLGLPAGALIAAVMTGIVFLIIGAVKSLWSTWSWWVSALETFAIGMSAAGLAYLVGAGLRGLVGMA
ncbi:VIT1/CCC1 transporter family protein [Maritalea mediterranea]|uniref:VIT1/CCC1 transporter family protein n=1 Tax=Maritalea mediterranea TaxID=2909667 RepID=A0ABS9E9G1_9HYPH|nr:VIT1/CCC1 transporter family protein [Maritalea mediterranea]MCF4098028.1 VIT1/CCC1 transporter family protein [Maritalea mediterranea]